MSKLISASICVTDIPKEKITPHTNGKKYLAIDIWVNDEPDKFGNDCSVNIRQTKDEREANERKIYVGNGQTKFGFDGGGGARTHNKTASKTPRPPADPDLDVMDSDCPF